MADKVDQIPPALPGQMHVTSRKIFLPSGEEPPIFINSAEFVGMGMDVFMDVGVVPVESIAAATKTYQANPERPALVDFHVSFRFGMSIQTALMIHQRLTHLIQQSAAQVEGIKELSQPHNEGRKGA